MKRTFEQARAYLTQAALSQSYEEREAVILEVRSEPNFFEGYSRDGVRVLQDIWSDVINGTREIALARSLKKQ